MLNNFFYRTLTLSVGNKMNNLKIEMTPEDFKALESSDKKLDVIYSALVGQQKHCGITHDADNVRFSKLEKRKLRDTGTATLAGTIAGFLGGLFRTSVS